MNKDAIVFAMANPTPEIMPDDAKAGGVRVMATGRPPQPANPRADPAPPHNRRPPDPDRREDRRPPGPPAPPKGRNTR